LGAREWLDNMDMLCNGCTINKQELAEAESEMMRQAAERQRVRVLKRAPIASL